MADIELTEAGGLERLLQTLGVASIDDLVELVANAENSSHMSGIIPMPWPNALDRFRSALATSPKETARTYRCILKKVEQHLSTSVAHNTPLHQITADVWTAYQDRHRDQAINTVRRDLGCVLSWYAFSREQGWVIESPNTRLPRPEGTLPKAPSRSQYSEMLRAAGKTRHPLRDTMILWTFANTGLRLEELRKLRLSDVVLEAGRESLKVQGKGSRERIVVLHPSFAEYLAGYIRHSRLRQLPGDPFLFSADATHQDPFSARGIERIVALAASKTTPDPDRGTITTHSLRHFNAVEYMRRGLHLEYLRRHLGHKSIQTTTKYLNVTNRELIEEVRKHHPLSHESETNSLSTLWEERSR